MALRPALLLPLLLAGCFSDPGNDEPAPTTTAPNPGDASWTTRAAMPIPRTEVTCGAHDGDIYVLGGFDQNNVATNLFHRYDADADSWHTLASFPVGIHHTGLVAYGNNLYAFGGYTGNFPFMGTNAVWRYDPAANTWSLFTTLPRMRGAHATVSFDDEVYLIGGAPQQPGQETYSSVDIFDFRTGQTRAGPTLGASREHLAGSAAAETIVAAGGRRMTLSNFGTTETLKPGEDEWRAQEEMPTPRGGIAAATWGSSVFVFGGEGTAGTFDEAESYDVQTGSWTSWPQMPHPRHGLCAAALPDGIHVIGGGPEPGLTVSDHHEVLSFTGS